MTLLAHLAQIEWQQRLAFARAAVAGGRWSPVEADAKLMPWLAVALLAGAEPAEAAAELEYLRRDEATRTTARATLADRLCAGPEMRAVLTHARDAAVKAALAAPADRKACDHSTRLQYLAIFLACPPQVPPRHGEGDHAQRGGGVPADRDGIAA